MKSKPLSAAALYRQLEERGKADFVVQPGATLRYDQLLRDLQGCCGLFDSLGLSPGDRVLIVTSDEFVAISVFLAALVDGFVPVMLAHDTRAPRVAAIAQKASPRLIVTDAARQAEEWAKSALLVAAPEPGLLGKMRSAKTGLRAEIARSGRALRLPEKPDALAYILFTSGTTSAPKGAMITHGNLFAHLATLSRLSGHDQHSRIFNAMPLAHTDGLTQGPLLAAANGCAVIRPGPFSVGNLEPWLNSVRGLGATHFQSAPTVYALIDRYAAHDDYFDASEFRCLISSSAELDENLWCRLATRFGKPIYNQYGLTETVACGVYAGAHPEMGAIGTIGKPVDMTIRLVGLDGRDVAEGEIGEIWLSGDNVFAGYLDEPRLTSEVLTDDGWLRTGDLGRMRPDGSFEIKGRLKTVILCGGLLIRPEEIDEVLLAHSAVAEVATFGVSDPDFGEVPISAVVLGGQADEVALTEHCRMHLEAMKVPKRIVTVEAIPRGDSGKPRLDALRAMVDATVSATTRAGDVRQAVLEMASLTFRVPVDSLSLAATADEVSGWDSFAHINLILRTERRFGKRIPTRDVSAIRTLADLAEAIERFQ